MNYTFNDYNNNGNNSNDNSKIYLVETGSINSLYNII